MKTPDRRKEQRRTYVRRIGPTDRRDLAVESRRDEQVTFTNTSLRRDPWERRQADWRRAT